MTTPHSEIRVLTVRQPWAWAIIHGGKNVENRTTSIAGSYRGPVAIHVGLAFPFTQDCKEAERIVGHWPPITDRNDRVINAGHIIGVVDLVDVHRDNRIQGEQHCCSTGWHAGECPGMCSPWAQPGNHHLVLANPRAIDPIPYRGGLGLRRITDPNVIERLGL